MKKIFKISLIIFVLFFVFSTVFLFFLSRGLDEGMELSINNVDLLSLEDGLYRGSYDGGRWGNKIEVEVIDNQIVQLNLVRDFRFSRQWVIDELFDNVIKSQSLDVDVVSEATVSSKAYLKAIENALSQY
ncbi:FMN-binding protein [Natronospora cellulosivora (SeqCode)]